MFCKTCGATLPDGAKYCGKCGATTEVGAEPVVAAETTEVKAAPETPVAPPVAPPVAAPVAPPAAAPPAPPAPLYAPPPPVQPPYAPAGNAPQPYPYAYAGGQPPKKNRGLMWGLIAAGLIVVLAGAGIGAYFLLRDGDDKVVTSTTGRVTTTTSVAATTSSSTSTTVAETTTTGVTLDPRSGGIMAVFIHEPSFIDPLNLQESEGIEVGNALFDSLLAFDYKTGALLPAAATSWEANPDATVWTFHLVEGATFHDGSPVTAKDFKYAWERICDPDNQSEIAYHLSAVAGYDDMQSGSTTELSGVRTVDDYTLEVTLAYPFGDFEYVVGHPALAPIPQAAVEVDPAGFSENPVGNGPFKMAEPWAHDQYISVVRYDGYYGTRALLDGVDFMIFRDDDTAWMEFQAGNLDFTSIPSGSIASAVAEYGESADGISVEQGRQVLLGPEASVYYMLLNTTDSVLSNPALRQALSLAINRQAIADTLYEGVRQPASSIVPEGVDGYEEGAWQYSRYDVEAAKAKLVEAGYPGGQGLPDIVISMNAGSGHEDVMAMVQSDWAKIGVNATLDAMEWAQYLDQLGSGDYMAGRLGWIADYPIIDNFLFPLFYSGSLDNYSYYQSGAVDQALEDARQTVDTTERIREYQRIVRMIGDDCPLIPLFKYGHYHVGSDRVSGLVYSSMGLLNLEQVWLARATY